MELIKRHKIHWLQKGYLLSSMWAVIFFAVSMVVNIVANNYATLNGQHAVTDIVLSNIRVFDVDAIVNYGPFVILIIVLTVLAMRPAAIPFTIKSLAFFFIIRAVFISVTHLGQFTPQLVLSPSKFFYFLGGGNTGGLFFSGHTGVPFLLALIFWSDKRLRFGFIALSVLLGTSMLLAHLHYSIDVLGAFFITPTIHHLAQRLFKQDYKLLLQS